MTFKFGSTKLFTFGTSNDSGFPDANIPVKFGFGDHMDQFKNTTDTVSTKSDQVRGPELKYKKLCTIETKLLTQIASLYVFTQNGSDIIFITNDSDVYGLGSNNIGRLGLGSIGQVVTPLPIADLCGKRVKKIASGLTFMVALIESNVSQFSELYTWGDRKHGQLGNGMNSSGVQKPTKLEITESIIDVECALTYTTFLTQTGSVFCFGCIDQSFGFQLKPTKCQKLDSIEFIAICCGANHSLALTLEGKVYSWGMNTEGKLGLGHNLNVFDPNLIEMNENVFIKQIVCGSNHSLLLSTEGQVYAFGGNRNGQLGIGCFVNKNKPKLIIKGVKFDEIFAINETSIARTKNCVYIWGKTKDWKFEWPKVTSCASIQDTIDTYLSDTFSQKALTYRELFEGKPITRLQKTMSKAFNNSLNSDLKFTFKATGAEDQHIYGHKWFIAANSQHFETMFSKEWTESKTNEVLITDYTYEAYYQYIRCLYTETIDCENIEVLMELIDITNRYLDEDVKYLCSQHLKPLIALQNVCALYDCAVRYRSAELEDFCFEFIVKNIVQILDSETYHQMDSAFAKQMLTNYVKYSEQIKN